MSLVVMGGLTPRLWRRKPSRLDGLSVVIVSLVIANAFVTGVLSTVEDRYQCRVIWLLALLAGLFVLDWLDHWQRSETEIRRRVVETADHTAHLLAGG